MKILLLNPQIDAGHNLFKTLESKDIALLNPSSVEEAWQMLQLHGTSIDLAVIHREGNSNPEEGLALIRKIKSDPEQKNLPFVISSSQWSEEDCGRHQNTPEGANAYLRWPFKTEEFLTVLDAMFQTQAGSHSGSQSMPSVPGLSLSPTPEAEPSAPQLAAEPDHTSGFVLEDARATVNDNATQHSASNSLFQLEAPDFGDANSSSAPAPVLNTAPVAEMPQMEPLPEIPATLAAPAAPADATQIDRLVLPDQPPAEATRIDRSPLAEPASPAPTEDSHEPAVDSSMNFVPEDDRELRQEMPYLFRKKIAGPSPAMEMPQPIGNAIIPGGAAQDPDLETLKKYLLLREQDVAALSTQLRETQQQVQMLESLLMEERSKNTDSNHQLEDARKRIENFEREKAIVEEGHDKEIAELKFQMKVRTDKSRILEGQVREATSEMERLKDRVRMDIRKIRVREKELENKLEIIRKDSEVLINARENKIIELKRKLDLLEFNMDLLQNQYSKERELTGKLRERLAKAAQVVRVAGGFLDTPGGDGDADAAAPLTETESDRKAS